MQQVLTPFGKDGALISFYFSLYNNIACHQQAAQLLIACNLTAKKEACFRERLKFTIVFFTSDENYLLVCTIYYRTEEVVVLKANEMPTSIQIKADN